MSSMCFCISKAFKCKRCDINRVGTDDDDDDDVEASTIQILESITYLKFVGYFVCLMCLDRCNHYTPTNVQVGREAEIQT